MKKYENKLIPYQYLDKTICDLCNSVYNTIIKDSFSKSETSEVHITHEKSTNYAYDGGGHGEKLELDICAACFEIKILPALKALGVQIEYKEYDY